jgi:hypothetical protein
MMSAATMPSLIPVLVTGIQPREVLRVKGLFRVADATLLDPCDKHRDEGKDTADAVALFVGWGG